MALSFIFERIIKTKRAIDIRTAGCMDDGRCGEKEGGAGNPGCLTKWTMLLRDWRMAVSRFISEFGDRLNGHC
jgi:hypothetical protein